MSLNDYAVVIGVNHYKKLAPLNGPIGDAKNFKNWLLSSNGANVPAENCEYIESNGVDPFRPIQDDIDEALARIVEKQSNGIVPLRRLYFFFAGHGVGVKWDVNGLCMPKWSGTFRNAALSSKGYLDFIVESDLFEEVYFFLDCCRDKNVNANPLHPTLGWPRPGGGKTMSLVLYASDFENPAYESLVAANGNLYVRGHFSSALLGAVTGAAANTAGEITIGSLIEYVRNKTEELARFHKTNQTVAYQFNSAAKSINHLFATTKPPATQVTVLFKEPGTIKIEDPNLVALQEMPVKRGDKWKAHLLKGVYSMRNLTTGSEKFIKVDGSLKSLQYEF